MAGELSPGVLEAICIIERVGSVFSLLGCLFVILTFSFSKAFHKPINRLVFYASFGNMMSNVGCIMSRGSLGSIDSFGCQFQGFLIQMFLPADAFWTLAMAFNVYLTFYHKFDVAMLRGMEIYYLIICYGIPFIPALTFIFIKSESAGRMYGNATLWCWVSDKWDIFRIATFYAPVWVVILATMAIYIRTGGEIYRNRKQLRSLGTNNSVHDHDPPLTMNDPFSTKTTEVTVTSEAAENSHNGIRLAPLGRLPTNRQYSVTISSDSRNNSSSSSSSQPDQQNAIHPVQSTMSSTPPTTRAQPKSWRRKTNLEANSAAWSYSKCAILFFTALLVTWIPSSANRVYSIINTSEALAALEVMSATVLPLQGFWNMLIYMATSWGAVKSTFSDIKAHFNGQPPDPNRAEGDHQDKHHHAFKLPNRRSRKELDSESMRGLADSGKSSHSNRDVGGSPV
ncbi:hypothetical protein M426DRAFT_72967 [Hypoxylon sp. CI-4A]|nr:hypothetical protein M426DRAFT_72967 [Hypoxylon sp. CI-4A]